MFKNMGIHAAITAGMAAVFQAAEAQAALMRGHLVGPGRRSVLTLHRRLWRSRYSGDELRALRAKRGVGRPPHLGINRPC